MSRLLLVCALIVLSVATVAEARAQAANPEPAYCAQYYPNANCNSIGPATPGAAPAAVNKPEEAAPPPPPAPKKAAARKKKPTPTTAAAPAK